MEEVIALDSESVRSIDENGFLHVARSPVTREQVAPYWGHEIPGWEEHHLEPDKKYFGYRPAAELEKPATIQSLNGIPIQFQHHPDYADAPARDTRVGSTGTDAVFEAPFLVNSLHIQDQRAIDRINDGTMRELSLGYRYEPDFTPGEFNGQPYDFVMRNINCNHVALVEEGRAGHGVLVLDARPDSERKTMAEEVKEVPAAEEAAQDGFDIETCRPALQALVAKGVNPVDLLEQILNAPPAPPAPPAEPAAEAVAPAVDEETHEEAADDEPQEGEDSEKEPAPATDAEDTPNYDEAIKSCGLDASDPAVQQAFAEGVKYGKEEEGANPVSQVAQDAQIKTIASIIDRKLRERFRGQFKAARECAPTLGNVDAMAYDSAGSIYKAALSKSGIKTSNLSDEAAMAAYRAFRYASGRRLTTDRAPAKKEASGIDRILSRVRRG